MCFGIMAMQMSALGPPSEAVKDPVAYISGFDHAAFIRRIATSGFKLVELGGDLDVALLLDRLSGPAGTARSFLSYHQTKPGNRWT